MSRPPVVPKTTAAGIAVDPRTLDRVIPESKRPDGTLRKEVKIRPGFTPQEDVQRFRSTRQAAADTGGQRSGVPGWAPAADSITIQPAMSQAARKNAKKREKKKEKKDEDLQRKIAENWDDDDDDGAPATKAAPKPAASAATPIGGADTDAKSDSTKATADTADALAAELEGLKVQ